MNRLVSEYDFPSTLDIYISLFFKDLVHFFSSPHFLIFSHKESLYKMVGSVFWFQWECVSCLSEYFMLFD
jgi:hypothetical protein